MLILSNIWSLANTAFASITTSSHWHSTSVCFGQEASDTDSCYFQAFSYGNSPRFTYLKSADWENTLVRYFRLENVLRTSIDKSLESGTNVVLWGIVLMLQAIPQTFGPIFFLRILLGMCDLFES